MLLRLRVCSRRQGPTQVHSCHYTQRQGSVTKHRVNTRSARSSHPQACLLPVRPRRIYGLGTGVDSIRGERYPTHRSDLFSAKTLSHISRRTPELPQKNQNRSLFALTLGTRALLFHFSSVTPAELNWSSILQVWRFCTNCSIGLHQSVRMSFL